MSEHEKKMFGLQMQVRQNQQELMDYVNELEGWENEIKQKEEQLKKKPDIQEQVSTIELTHGGGLDRKQTIGRGMYHVLGCFGDCQLLWLTNHKS